jgi:hypothetical protein
MQQLKAALMKMAKPGISEAKEEEVISYSPFPG